MHQGFLLSLVGSRPVGTPGFIAMGIGFLLFLVSLLFARRRGEAAPKAESETTAGGSFGGVAIQTIGFASVGFGPVRIELAPDSPRALIEAAAIGVLMLLTVLLFVTASRALGKNWAIVARTRSDHQLVTDGPFALMRNPIYTALFLIVPVMALTFGHWRGLILAVPLYWIGTWIRVRHEERLLRAQFGAAYDDYARRVKRFVPGII